MAMNKEDILEAISNMTVLEIVDLISAMEEKFGVSAAAATVAVAAGPGSFTGLRIGMATAKALAYGADKIVLGIPTLDALAFNVIATEKLIVPIMNARRNEVYTAIYRGKKQGVERLSDYMALSPEELRLDLLVRGEDVLLLGDGVPVFREIFQDEIFNFTSANNSLNRASSIGKLAMERLQKGEVDDYYLLSPAYLRNSQAEVNWQAKYGVKG